MDEVDRIIIHSLNDIGCVISDDITSLGQFSTKMVVEASVRCLDVIKPGLGIPPSLPANMAARFNIAASIAAACKEIGYGREVGYQTFLYSNTAEVRRLFMFLIEKLPKESEKTEFVSDDPLSRLKADVGRAVREQMSKCERPSVVESCPFVSAPLQTGIILPGVTSKEYTPQEWRDYCINRLPFLTDQVRQELVLPSVVALMERSGDGTTGRRPNVVNDAATAGGDGARGGPTPTPRARPRPRPPPRTAAPTTWLALRQNILYTAESSERADVEVSPEDAPSVRNGEQAEEEETETEAEESGESPEEARRKEVERVKTRIEELQSAVSSVTAQIAKVKDAEAEVVSAMKEKRKEAEARRRALELVEEGGAAAEGEVNRRKLEEAVEGRAGRLVALAAQWERRRRPLVDRYREARRAVVKSANESEKRMESVRELQDKLDSLNRQMALKSSVKSKLEEDYEKLPKNVNRSVYTRRILEIIGNIKKQGEEIDKILNDTKELRKEINSVTGRIERSFTVTDEVIFRNAKRDESSRRAYKLLITLHSDCSDLVAMLQETGTTVRETRDLQDQIDVELAKNVGANLERISADLEQMRVENAALVARLKQLRPT